MPSRPSGSTKSTLQLVSVLMIIVGGALTIGFFASFVGAFDSGGGEVPSIGLGFLGIPLLGGGISLARFAFLGEVSRYVADEVGPSARMVLGGIGRGTPVLCPDCRQENDQDAKFCDGCGRPLRSGCAACGAANDADAKFCDACGAAL